MLLDPLPSAFDERPLVEESIGELDAPEGPNVALADWTVRASAHSGFPRWDGPTATAFDRATWQFEVALPDVYDAFVRDDSVGSDPVVRARYAPAGL